MARTRLIVELGTGIDIHGQDYTLSATRAVDDAVHRSGLLYLADARKEGRTPTKLYIDVTIASPKPEAVDTEAVLQPLVFGEKSVKVVAGGMEVEDTAPDRIVISNAAILVTMES